MADKKEVNMLLLGMVAILAIVGLVLMFTSPAATGKAFFPPQLPPDVQSPAALEYPVQTISQQAGQVSNAVYVTKLEGASLPLCPSGRLRTRMQGNIPYEAVPGHLCSWFYCPAAGDSTAPSAQPLMACVKMP